MKILSFVIPKIHIIKRTNIFPISHKNIITKDMFIPQNISVFKDLKYEKSKNLNEAAMFAKKFFGVENFNICDLSSANLLNRVFTKIYNTTKGKAVFPPNVSVIKNKNARFTGACSDTHIEVIKNPCMSDDIVHEIGHYNHQKSSSNYDNMGKLQELNLSSIKDFTIYEQFKNDKKSLMLIKKYVCPYATSSAAEFVACAFNSIINGKKLPNEIYELYKKYEGPEYYKIV